MGSKQHHFVLVHGAGHGAWCWVKIVAALEKAGHHVTAIDLASAGENTELADDITSLALYSRPLDDLFQSFPDDKKVILVGHSLGGMSVARASELFPRKISVAVYMAAFMPGPGLNFTELRASDPEFIPSRQGKPIIYHSKIEGGLTTSAELPPDRLKNHFYNKCLAEDFSFASGRVKSFPHLPNIFLAISLTEENWGSVPRVYVLSTQDRLIDPASARKMVMLTPVNEIHELDGDHSFFFSAVDDATKVLNDVAAKYDSYEEK